MSLSPPPPVSISSTTHVVVSSRPSSRSGGDNLLKSAGSAIINESTGSMKSVASKGEGNLENWNHGSELHTNASSLLEQYKKQSASHLKDLGRRWRKKEEGPEEGDTHREEQTSNGQYLEVDEGTFVTAIGLDQAVDLPLSACESVTERHTTAVKRWGGGDFQLSLKVSDAVEDTMSPALLQGTQDMPEKVHIQEIMDVTSEVVNLKGRSKKIWDKHFRSDTSKAIIQDSFWYVVSRFFDQPRDRHKYLQQGNKEKPHDDSENDEEMGRSKTPPDTGRSLVYSHERAGLQFKDSFPFSSEKNDESSRLGRRTREAKRLKEQTQSRAAQKAARRRRLASLKDCPDRGQLVVVGGLGDDVEGEGFDYEDENQYREQQALQMMRARDLGLPEKNKRLVRESASKVQGVVLERIARNFVRLFTQIQSVENDPVGGKDNIHPILLPRETEKDIFLHKFSDGLAQSLFYSLCIAYPKSRKEISNSHFRSHLARLASEWVHGVPLNPDTSHWKILQKEPKANTLLQQALQFETEAPGHVLDKKFDFVADRLDHDRRGEEGRRPNSGASNNGFEKSSPINLSKGSPSNRSIAGARSLGLLRGGGESSRNAQDRLAQTPAVKGDSLSPSVLIHQANTKLNPPKKVIQETRIGNAAGGLNNNYNLFRDPTIKDVERAEEHKQHAHALNPVRRTGRNLEQLGHSSLIKHFLGLQQIERQKNVALAIPLTSNDGFPTPAEELSSAMKLANISLQESNVTLNTNLIQEKKNFSRMANRELKGLAEKRRKNDMERDRALRDAAVFSKTLVAEYQSNKYGELKNPSKSIALRRLGHFRSYKEEELAGSLMNRESDTVVLMQSRMHAVDE